MGISNEITWGLGDTVETTNLFALFGETLASYLKVVGTNTQKEQPTDTFRAP